MLIIKVLLIIGYTFNLSHEAAIVSLSIPFFNKSLEIEDVPEKKTKISNGDLETGFVKLPPGSKIFFYTTEDEHLMIGPKLQSEEEITILVLDQDNAFKKYMPFNNSYMKTDTYFVLKSGVLVPRKDIHKKGDFEAGFTNQKCNKCVYQSLKPIYYVKGFKDILIPVDILYSRSKQEKLFRSKNLESKPLPELSLDLSNNDQSGGRETIKLKVDSDANSKKNTRNSPSEKDFTLRQSEKDFIPSAPINGLDDFSQDISNEEVKPDKTCNGEVTLFVLQNNGILKRMPSDPFFPIGLHLSYSLLDNLILKPKFLGGSDVVLSYVTGENGDLIPHPKNQHKVVAEDRNSVCFMLSSTGGMFPVKDEKGENRSINYYFNSNLIHESQQFAETFSNSTYVLINNKKFQIFENIAGEKKYNPYTTSEECEEQKKANNSHHLRKRDVYYNGYERRGNEPSGMSHSVMESPALMRQPSSMMGQNRIIDYQPSISRGQSPLIEHQPPFSSEPSIINSQLASRIPLDSNKKCTKPSGPYYESNPQTSSSSRNFAYPQLENLDQNAEDTTMDPLSTTWENQPLKPRTDIFTFDEKGNRIRLIPEITDNNDVVIYKLTCKGNLVRYPSCKEPEFGFEIHFQLLLDEFVLVPSVSNNKPFHITYVLQENGDLVPAEGNVNTFRKAPGSLIYYMLGKNNVLFPVQQVIDMEGNVSFFYQDLFLLKMKDSIEKPLHFSTKGSPLFAFFNGFTMITISSKPRLNSMRGSNWNQLKSSDPVEAPPKAMFLTGPKGELIKIAPYKNKQGATVIYELDCNGIFYRSPKDKKKCIILRSYILLKEGILLPSNDTTGYVYMMSKNGDLFPYLYPEGKIEAPLASSLKYVLCEKGILLPIKLEIIDSHICYIFRDVVVYKERVYCKTCLDRLDEEQQFESTNKKSSCDIQSKESVMARGKDIKLFVNKDGDYVFYEKEDKVLKRYPPELVPSYLKYTMGSFEIKPDGSLYQVRYQNPSENVVNLMLEPNGDLLEDTKNINKVRSQYYVLDEKGNLISVDVKKTKKNLYFYKDYVRVCRVPIPNLEKSKTDVMTSEDELKTPLGKDPMGLMEDPFPPKSENGGDTRSLYIPIPLKAISIADSPETCLECTDSETKKKCEMLKDTLQQVSKGTSLPLALELELTDEIMKELKNWASNCDKVLDRRDVADNIRQYINNLRYADVRNENS